MADNSGNLGYAFSSQLMIKPIAKKRGSDFSGANMAVNRTLTYGALTQGFEIWIDGASKHLDQDFTYDGTTITILFPLADASYIDIQSFGV